MPLPQLPTRNLDDLNHRRGHRETTNNILNHNFDDSKVQTPAEVLAGVTPVNKAYPPGDVRRYGARNDVDTGNPATLIDCAAAVRLALSCNNRIYFPPGTYYMLSTIAITGTVVIITGEAGGTLSALASRIVYDGTGEVFSATGTEFGGIYIGHLQISGGDRSGAYAIVSTRPQSVFERLHMELWNNSGIKVSKSSQGSFGTRISYCKHATDGTANAFTSFDISVDGGDIEVRSCTGISTNIGVDIHQGQDIRIIGCNFNKQNSTSSTETAANGQCAIRLTGTVSAGPPEVNYKPNITITENYLEGCTTAVRAESAEGLAITHNFVNDVGVGLGLTATRGFEIDSSCQNVEISHNHVLLQADNAVGVKTATSNKIRVINNYFNVSGATPLWMSVTARTDYGWNQIIAGTLSDASNLAISIEPVRSSFTGTLTGCTTSPTATFKYTLGDGMVTMLVPTLTAVSNTTAATITGFPAALMPLTLKRMVCRIVDNSVTAFGMVQLDPATAGTITLGVGPTFAAFTNVNNKGVSNTEISWGVE